MLIEQTVQQIIIDQDVSQIEVRNLFATIEISQAAQGPMGLSAYQIALKNGFLGTETEWLNSLSVQADLAPSIVTLTGDTVLNNNHATVLVDATGSPVTIAVPVSGKVYNIKKIDSSSNPVIVIPVSGLVDGSSEAIITGQYTAVTVQGNQSNLFILAR